jgi:flagellar protein FlaI
MPKKIKQLKKTSKKTFLSKLLKSKKKPKELIIKSVKKKPKIPSQEQIRQFIISLAEKKDIRYSLISDLAYVDIKWEENENQFVYNVREPKFSPEEEKIYSKMVSGLMEILDVELSAIKKKEEAQNYLQSQIKKVLEEYEIKISEETYIKILYFVQRNFVGLNEIEPLMQDPYIEDISCDGVGIPIYVVHRKYGSIKTNIAYNDAKDLRGFVVKLAERSGRFISYAEPLLDGTLPDGSRVQATFAADVTTRGPSFTIRKFVQEPFSPIDLMNKKSVSSETLAYLWLSVESGASILVAGGAGTGKTTLLNALLMFVPNESKIITIEDTRELNIPHENWIPAVTRIGFAKGFGEVTMFDLLKEAFRQTPDYVIVGEVRGQEAYVMFQGMAAGIPAMGTMHAGRVDDVIYRLETPPINLSPALIDTLDIVLVMIHAREKGESSRRLKEIVEIESVDSTTGKVRTNQVYHWSASEDTYEFAGTSYFLQEIAAHKGVEVTTLLKEIEKRKALLDWMQKKGMNKYKDVVRILTEYRKNPEKVLKDAGITA